MSERRSCKPFSGEDFSRRAHEFQGGGRSSLLPHKCGVPPALERRIYAAALWKYYRSPQTIFLFLIYFFEFEFKNRSKAL
jgi:hypothetical protein